MRLYKLNDQTIICNALERVNNIEAMPFSRNMGSEEQRETAIAEKEQKEIYRFLLEDYSGVLERCKSEESYLGWSSDVKGTIVPLLLLYLKKDGKRKTKAEQRLIEDVKYRIKFKDGEEESFGEYLSIWRQLYSITEAEKQKIF